MLEAFTTLPNQGEFQMEASLAVAIAAKSSADWVLQVKSAGLEESEMAAEVLQDIFQGVPAYLVV